ncbi:MAG: hydrogenase [Deltaproteobacteria bacterium]|nr:hydrogenase [Deltaproteobacteria bacterium]
MSEVLTTLLPSLVSLALALGLALWMLGLLARTKARFAGRAGAPLMQRYRDVFKLLGKGAVYSRTTSAIFKASPIVALATTLVALSMVPLGEVEAAVHFDGDLFVVAGLLALGRFITMLAALDTGSPFEGMGASREAHFGALLEPVFLISLLALARLTGASSLTDMMQALHRMDAASTLPVVVPLVAALGVAYLVENSRMPVDDPTTHLELTMIHEVMILDHCGPDLAFIEYAAALKQWLFAALLVGVVLPIASVPVWASVAVGVAGIAVVTVAVGVVESSMARLRLLNVPGLILGAGAASVVAFLLTGMVH